MGEAQKWVPKRPNMEPWTMEPRTKIVVPGLILTHALNEHRHTRLHHRLEMVDGKRLSSGRRQYSMKAKRGGEAHESSHNLPPAPFHTHTHIIRQASIRECHSSSCSLPPCGATKCHHQVLAKVAKKRHKQDLLMPYGPMDS